MLHDGKPLGNWGEEALRIVEQTPQRIRLQGIPGGGIWMCFAMLLGLTVMLLSTCFAWISVHETESYWPILPLGFGFLMGGVFFSIGSVTLLFGRMVLTLDRMSGKGSYEVRSPIIDVGKPCSFELSQIQSITLEKSSFTPSPRDAPEAIGSEAPSNAKFCTAVLRLKPRRRKIVLDETQNGRDARVSGISIAISEWLPMPLIREYS